MVATADGTGKRRCAKRLKLRLVETKEPHKITKCYACGQASKIAEARAKDTARRISMGRA
jgi:hypothetical protein